MSKRSWYILGSLIVALVCVSCNKEGGEPATGPTTQPIKLPHATTLPTEATFTIAGQPFVFQKPAVRFSRDGGAPQLGLFSDPGTRTPSFYFEIPLDADREEADPIVLDQHTHLAERQDSLIGIELPETTLQPESLTITVQPIADNKVHVELSGTFPTYAGEADVAQSRVEVRASFDAAIAIGRK